MLSQIRGRNMTVLLRLPAPHGVRPRRRAPWCRRSGRAGWAAASRLATTEGLDVFLSATRPDVPAGNFPWCAVEGVRACAISAITIAWINEVTRETATLRTMPSDAIRNNAAVITLEPSAQPPTRDR